MKLSKKRICARIIFTLLTIACATAIFVLSAQSAAESADLSGGLTESVLSLFPAYRGADAAAQSEMLVFWDDVFRTLAHGGVYFVAGLSCMLMWKAWDVGWPSLFTLVSGLLYAVSDEVHQIFVDGRAFEVKDIITDFAGVLLAAALIAAISAVRRGRRRKR